MKVMVRVVASIWIAGCALSTLAQTTGRLAIDTTARIADVSPTLYGLMTEEINFSYDGGLYAEMVRNRVFKSPWSGNELEHWTLVTKGNAQARMELDKTSGPSTALPESLKLIIDEASAGNEAGVGNDGYWGMAVRTQTVYRGSFYARMHGGGEAHAKLISNVTGAVLAEAAVPVKDGDWQRYSWTTNTIDRPDMIHPVMSKIPVTAKAWHHAVPANTIEVIDIPLH